MTTQPPLHIVLYEPEIPYNTGSVGRTCVATGAKLWLVRPLGFQVDDHHLRRAGLDYWKLLDWEVVNDWQHLLQRLPAGRKWFFSKKGEKHYDSIVYEQGDVFVFGSESSGLPESLTRKNAEALLKVPQLPAVRSLNLSNTVAIVTYEALRQGIAGMEWHLFH